LCRPLSPLPLSNEHCLFHLISQSSMINQSHTHPPHTLCTFTHTLGLSHRLCCFSHFLLSLLLVERPAPLLSSLEQPFSTLLHDFAPLPSRFSENFTHTIPPISSPHISKRQTKRNPLSRRCLRLGLAAVRWTRIMYNNLRASCHPWRRGCTFILYSALSIFSSSSFLYPCRQS